MKEREKFGSRIGFILVSAGCAVGIGNVWKFPYICGQNGGAIFILIYLVFLALLGFPIMVAEFSVGRASQKSCATSFKILEQSGSRWHNYGYFGMAGNYLLMMFYTVVAGWMMYYCFRSIRGDFADKIKQKEQIGEIMSGKFGEMLGNGWLMLGWAVVAILIAFAICSLGVQKGVEKITKIMMVCLLILIVVLAVHSVTLKGSGEGVRFYLVPSIENVKKVGLGNVIYSAMNQAFFTLSCGIGAMAIFGSYLDKDRSLSGEAVSIICIDTFVALMAGMIIIPACFAYGVSPNAGPSLLFITLPTVFNQMPFGQVWGTLFFLFMSFAALSTVVAVFENIISFAMDLWKMSRLKAVIVNIFAIIILSAPCAFGFNKLAGFQPLGAGTGVLDLEDFLVSNNLLPLGSVIYLLFCVSKNGFGWDNFIKEADLGDGLKFPNNKLSKFYLSYILPLLVVAIYLIGYYEMFKEQSKQMFIGWMCFSILPLLFICWLRFGKAKK